MERPGLIAVVGALAVALAAAAARLAARRGGDALAERERPRARTMSSRFRRSAGEEHTCACGAEYRVSGTDRHRVFWPAGAPESSPVLGDRCVECDAELPTGRAARAPRT